MIYLDMDGVLSDFNAQYKKMFGVTSDEVKGEARHKNWKQFIEQKAFEKLPFLPSAYALLDFISKNNLPAEILSSSGGPEFHSEVEAQKMSWLIRHGIKYKPNIVPGGMKKAAFANSSSILIDDTDRVVNNFKKAGGLAILHDHNNVNSTITQLKSLL